jgi:hypothetical protein
MGLFEFVYGPSDETLHRRRVQLAKASQAQPLWVSGPSDQMAVQGILARAENHLQVLKDMNSTESTIQAQVEYINAAKLVLTRLY